jgi:hypothetical protein
MGAFTPTALQCSFATASTRPLRTASTAPSLPPPSCRRPSSSRPPLCPVPCTRSCCTWCSASTCRRGRAPCSLPWAPAPSPTGSRSSTAGWGCSGPVQRPSSPSSMTSLTRSSREGRCSQTSAAIASLAAYLKIGITPSSLRSEQQLLTMVH